MAFGVFLAAGLATLKYMVLPKVAEYQVDILARVSAASGMDVSAKQLRGGWSGFTPFVEMEDVLFREPATGKSPPGSVALSLPLVRAAVSIPYLFIGQVHLAELTVFEPQLSLIRAADGFIYFAGRPLNKKTAEPDDSRFVDWLIAQPGIQVSRAKLTWRDDLTPGAELQFTDVGIQIDKRFGRHSFGFTATPPAQLAQKVELRGRVNLDRSDDANARLLVDGTLFADLSSINLTELRRHLNLPDNWQTGVGTVRAWIDLDNTAVQHAGRAVEGATATVGAAGTTSAMAQLGNPVKSVSADVHIINAKVQLGDDVAPLNIVKLAGRLEYLQQQDGFTVGSKKLEFRTREGVTSPPADFSFSRQVPSQIAATGAPPGRLERGEITANGIDLKVMTSLIAYFPVGKELRQTLAKFGMRGEVKASRFAWTGPLEKPASYQIKGSLVDFAALANDGIPGISGFSGTIDGDDKNGRFNIASKALTLDLPAHFKAPLRFDNLDSKGKWTVTAGRVDVDIDKFGVANTDLAAEFSGRYSRLRAKAGAELAVEDAPGELDIAGQLTRASATKVAKYLPNGLENTRGYIEWAARDGTIEGADFLLKGRVYDFPYHQGKGGKFSVKARIKDIDFRYAEGWPQADNISGELNFENTAMTANIESAQIFGARIKKTTLAVADFNMSPAILTIAGEADARAEDVSRYLRESPMVDGTGAFTKVVSIEGAGRLNLSLSIPLGSNAATSSNPTAPKFRIAGKYVLSRGSAKPVVGPLITALSGTIAFNESSVKSSAITGVAYGNPITVNIAGGGEAGVVTDFAGRMDVQQLGDLLPFQLPQQITGLTDFAGRIKPGPVGVDISVDSSMIGVTSTLPNPLGKRADEARRLNVGFTAVGQPAEKIRVGLLGNIARGSNVDAAETRVDARFQRRFDAAGNAKFFGGVATVGEAFVDGVIPEGVWFAGSLNQLDFDLWQKTIADFYPKSPATATAASDTGIAGFDFRLGRLIAYGRPFDELKIKGRRATDVWAVSVASKELEGDFTWRAAAFNERGAIRARLKKLILADELPVVAGSAAVRQTAAGGSVTSTGVTELAQNEGDLPALDVVADEFTFKDRWLGKLELKATPQVSNWKIDQLTITNGHAKADMSGIWQRYGDPYAPPSAGAVKSLTTMNIKVESSNLNALFAQFGFGDHMKGGRGGLDGTLAWPGHAYQFQLVNLSGAFKVNAERGQFAKIEAGAGKLLGLISLQSIPRRLSFDFRDLFSDGLAFDKIDGDLTIADGIMFAKKFDISGPATDVKMSGDVSLPAERQNLSVTVTPRLGTVAAVGTGLLVNPLVGLGVLLGGEVLRNPIERVLAVQYSITGTWDNPVIERTGKVVAPVTPAASATQPVPVTPVSAPLPAAPANSSAKDNKKPA